MLIRLGSLECRTLPHGSRKLAAVLCSRVDADSYGPGGYYKSPLAPIMPVSMELRREHRKLSVAIVVALDRSGSMACTVPDGRTKIQLADLATRKCCQCWGRWTSSLHCGRHGAARDPSACDCDVAKKYREDLLRIDSAGGESTSMRLSSKSADMLASPRLAHVTSSCFADAADSKQHPNGYEKIVDACMKAGVTVSVIGLGTEKDCDAALLQDVAKRGGGQCCLQTLLKSCRDCSHRIPLWFPETRFWMSRSTFGRSPDCRRSRDNAWRLAIVGGYNLCYLRPEATLPLSPRTNMMLRFSRLGCGLGRVLCYTGEADGKYTERSLDGRTHGDFFTSLARGRLERTAPRPRNRCTQELSVAFVA